MKRRRSILTGKARTSENSARKALQRLRQLGDARKARVLQSFFKSGPGQYGCGDEFLGIAVPEVRSLARAYRDLDFSATDILLASKFHEARLAALLILVDRFNQGTPAVRKKVYKYYLRRSRRINNWDLVDLTAHKIIGAFLQRRSKAVLYSLARSPFLWHRRIAVVATFEFIKHHCFSHTLRIAAMLLNDREDLIHKAVGWMLREVGKRDHKALDGFLIKHRRRMPRTMLRYAVERMSLYKKRMFLKK